MAKRRSSPAVKARKTFLALAFLASPAWLSCGEGGGRVDGYRCDDSHLVFFEPMQPPGSAAVIGDFNDWTGEGAPLADEDGDGIYTARIFPGPGTHQYRILADGRTILDTFNPLTLFDAEGRENSAVVVPDCTVPALAIDRLETGPGGGLQARLRFLRARGGDPLDAGTVRAVLEDGTPLAITAEEPPGDIEITAEDLPAGKHRLAVTAADRAGVEARPVEVPFWIETEPFDWRDAIIYQVMIDRFRRGGGTLDDHAGIAERHGGDLDGITEAIEEGYFRKLGANVLWLSPPVSNPEGEYTGRDGYPAEAYHGYWPDAPREVDERLGGAEALERLVATAHARGMRVLVDVVPNHVHQDHPYWREHAADGWFNHTAGDCICGFSCPWHSHIETCWFDPFLPDLDHTNPQVVEQTIDDLVWWLERFDLDGLRIDAVPMMPRLVTRHLRHRVRPLEGGGARVYLLGETYTGRGGQPVIRWYLGPHGLSGQFDFPVMWALRDALAGRVPMTELDAEMRRSLEAWEGSGAVMAPILGNHDVARFVSDVHGDPVYQPHQRPPLVPDDERPYDLLRIAWSFLLTRPGAPVIYYGDEIGMPGATDPDNRRNMRFGEALTEREAAVLTHVRRLGRARACSNTLRRGTHRTLLVHQNLLAWGRDAGDGHPALVVLNPATVQRRVALELPADWALAPDAAFSDLFGAPVDVRGREVTVTVPPRASAVLLSEAACCEVEP